MSQLPLKETDLLEHENRFLKQTIVTLREEFEYSELNHDAEVQEVFRKSEDEKTLLRHSINELRTSMDLKIHEFNEEKQKILESLTIDDKIETLENIINFYLHDLDFNNQTVQ